MHRQNALQEETATTGSFPEPLPERDVTSGDGPPDMHMPLLRVFKGSPGSAAEGGGAAPAVRLDAEPLRQSLHDMCEWFQARLEKSSAAVRSELDALLAQRSSAAFVLERDLAASKDSASQTEARTAALEQRLEEAERKSSDACLKSFEASARVEELGSRQSSLEEHGKSFSAEEKELLEQLKAQVDKVTAEQAERADGADERAELVLQMSANRRRIEELGVELRKEDKEVEHRVVQSLESRLEHQRLAGEATGKKLAGALDRLDEQAVKLEAVRAAAAGGEELKRLAAEVQQRGEASARADEQHALQLEASERAVRELEDRIRAEQEQDGRELRELRERLCAHGKDLETAARERAAEHADVQEALRSLSQGLEQRAAQGRNAEAKLNMQGGEFGDQLGVLEGQLLDLVGAMEDLQDQVDQSERDRRSEADKLQGSISVVASNIKDKQQSVLFGARCLSCNRVFDDVEQEAGKVDPRRDKETAHAMAEIQRAMHNPGAKPTDMTLMHWPSSSGVSRPASPRRAPGSAPGGPRRHRALVNAESPPHTARSVSVQEQELPRRSLPELLGRGGIVTAR